MRIAKYFGIAIIPLALSLTAMAKDVHQSTNEGQLVQANTVLQTKIDAKTAKVGDAVTARLVSSVHLSGGTEIPRNALLIGHIDQVQPAENNGVSTVVLTFDKAQPKDGQPIAIKSTIVGIQPSNSVFSPTDLNPQLKTEQTAASAHGYSLTSDVQGANSGVLKADGKNVHLEHGTEFEFALAPTAAGSTTTGN
jgi:hypothetical protein